MVAGPDAADKARGVVNHLRTGSGDSFMTVNPYARRIPVAALAVGLLLVGAAGAPAQEAKKAAGGTQALDVGGLTAQVPGAWKKLRPTSSMRQAELEIPAAQGDDRPGNLAVFVFPQGAGTVQANVQRWQQQFKGADGTTPAVQSEKVQGKNVEVTRVEVAGTYVEPPFSGGGTFPNSRLLGAIVETPRAAYFFKLVGPDGTIQAAETAFDAMIASMAAAE